MKLCYFFSGMPLSGKSTIARRLAAEEGLAYFSTGEFARSLGMGMESSIRTRDLSEQYDNKIIEEVVTRCSAGGQVIDGFPRSIEQFEILRSAFRRDQYRLYFVVANPLIIFDRMAKRRAHEDRPEDTHEVVADRVKRSCEWRRELQALEPDLVIIHEEEVSKDIPVLSYLDGLAL